jgi:hypothetical protein
MHKRDWIFYGHLHRHLVTLFHFKQTGRVMVYLNRRLLLEEVLPTPQSSHTYQFFIDDELCELELIYAPQTGFGYDFRSPNYSTSRYGRWQRWKDRLENLKIVGVLALMALILLPVAYYFWRQNRAEKDFKVGMMTEGTVMGLEPTFEKNELATGIATYTFSSDTKSYVGKQMLVYDGKTKKFSTLDGLPIRGGERFMVLFQPSNPDHNRMDFRRPTADQMKAYQTDVRAACVRHFSGLESSQAMMYCDCLSRFLVEQYGTEAIVRLHQSATPKTNHSQYNADTFEAWLTEQKSFVAPCEELKN